MSDRLDQAQTVRDELPFLKTRVSLALSADNLDPDEISSLLELQPTWAFKRGQEYLTHIDKKRQAIRSHSTGVWGLATDTVVSSVDPQDHIDYLIRLMRPKATAIKALLAREGYYGVIRIRVETMELVVPIGIRAECLAELGALCHEIAVVVIVTAGAGTL